MLGILLSPSESEFLQSIEQIFDFSEAFPSLENEEHEHHLAVVLQILDKVQQWSQTGQSFPEKESHELFALKDSLCQHPLVRYRYAEVLFVLNEVNAVVDVLGEIPTGIAVVHPVLYMKAIALIHLEKYEDALEILQSMVGSGWRHYELFMLAATVKTKVSDFRGAIAMANLAVYENAEEKPNPFVLMALCFEKYNETNRMFECFSRVENLVGQDGLEQHLGHLMKQYGEMYQQVKGVVQS